MSFLYKKEDNFLTLLFIAVFSVFILLLSVFPWQSDDIGTHLKTGQLIWESKSILTKDPFSFTKPVDKWINVEWLAQVVFYLIYHYSGVVGITLFKYLIILSVFLIIIRFLTTYYKINIISSTVLILIAYIGSDRFIIRPHLFSYLFISGFLAILYAYLKKPNRYIYLLPLMQLIWSNVNYGAILGVGIFTIFVVDIVISQQRLSKDIVFSYILTLIFACFNPGGVMIYTEPFKFFLDKFYNQRQYIYEWMSPFKKMYLGLIYIRLYFVLLFFYLVFFIVRVRFLGFKNIIFSFIFITLSLRGVRFIPLALIVMFFVLFSDINCWKFRIKLRIYKKSFLVFLLMFSLLVLYISINGYKSGFLKRTFGFGINPSRNIDSPLAFMDKFSINGNTFNQLDIGSYIIWKSYPKRKVFIDGRVIDCYSPDFFVNDYVLAGNSPEDIKRIINKYRIDSFFLLYSQGPIYSIWKFLLKDPSFALVYWDDFYLIFADIHKYPQLKPYVINTILPFYSDDDILEIIRNNKRGLDEMLKLATVSSNSLRINRALGLLAWELKDYNQAKFRLEKVVSYKRYYDLDPKVYFALADLAINEGNCLRAVKYLKNIALGVRGFYERIINDKLKACKNSK